MATKPHHPDPLIISYHANPLASAEDNRLLILNKIFREMDAAEAHASAVYLAERYGRDGQ
jgi:hypothetical protein